MRTFTRLCMAATAVVAFSAAPASAQEVFNDNFDAEGDTALNTTPSNWDATEGSVDILEDPNGFGLRCAGGTGSCIDLDGSTNSPGTIETLNSYSFRPGSLVTLSFDLSGNQRGAGPDGFFAAFRFVDPTNLLFAGFGDSFGSGTFANGVNSVTGLSVGTSIGAATGFQRYSIFFRPRTSGSIFASIGNTGTGDNQGPILDNVSLSIAAVPEPTTWAMMILGFGVIGGALRRRRNPVAQLRTA
jgi:PEP-CTERM motif